MTTRVDDDMEMTTTETTAREDFEALKKSHKHTLDNFRSKTLRGTNGYGRSDTRKNLRKFFEVDKEHIVAYSLSVLAKEQLIPSKYAKDAMKKYNIDSEKPIPTKL